MFITYFSSFALSPPASLNCLGPTGRLGTPARPPGTRSLGSAPGSEGAARPGLRLARRRLGREKHVVLCDLGGEVGDPVPASAVTPKIMNYGPLRAIGRARGAPPSHPAAVSDCRRLPNRRRDAWHSGGRRGPSLPFLA